MTRLEDLSAKLAELHKEQDKIKKEMIDILTKEIGSVIVVDLSRKDKNINPNPLNWLDKIGDKPKPYCNHDASPYIGPNAKIKYTN